MPRAGVGNILLPDTLPIYPLSTLTLLCPVLVTPDPELDPSLAATAGLSSLCIPGLYLLTILTLNRSVERLMRQFSGLTRCVKVTPPDPPGAPRPLIRSRPSLLVILNISRSQAFYIRTVHQASSL